MSLAGQDFWELYGTKRGRQSRSLGSDSAELPSAQNDLTGICLDCGFASDNVMFGYCEDCG